MSIRLNVAVHTSIGRVRTQNEDAFLVTDVTGGPPPWVDGAARFEVGPRGALLAVSDGMGGHKAGEVASAMTLESLAGALVDRTSVSDADARLVRATEHANAQVYEAGRSPSLAKMGATVTAVLIDGGTAHVAEVGDSRAYVVRSGEIHRLTLDQNLAALAVNAGMDPHDAEESPLRHVLAQAVGQRLDLSVAVSVLELRRRDCLVLSSDGLTGKVNDTEIRDLLLASTSLAVAARALVDLAERRGGEDNITVMLAGVDGDLPALAPGDRFSGTYRVLHAFEPAPTHAIR